MKDRFEENLALKTRLVEQEKAPAVEIVAKVHQPVAIDTNPADSAGEMSQERAALMLMQEDIERSRHQIEQAHQKWMAALDVVNELNG